MEYEQTATEKVPIPTLVSHAGQQDAYVAADADGRAAMLATLQADEQTRLTSVKDGDIPLVVVEA
jgi:hypothetical protein